MAPSQIILNYRWPLRRLASILAVGSSGDFGLIRTRPAESRLDVDQQKRRLVGGTQNQCGRVAFCLCHRFDQNFTGDVTVRCGVRPQPVVVVTGSDVRESFPVTATAGIARKKRLTRRPVRLGHSCFCLVLGLAANLIFRIPDAGLTVEQFNTFVGP